MCLATQSWFYKSQIPDDIEFTLILRQKEENAHMHKIQDDLQLGSIQFTLGNTEKKREEGQEILCPCSKPFKIKI